jgi:hypothetical protein
VVNCEKRTIASRLIARFASGEISNDDFVDEFPDDPADPALEAIRECLWYSYDDMSAHTLTAKHALTSEGLEVFNRCRAFLASGREYEWPTGIFRPSLLMLLLHIPGLNGVRVRREKRELDRLNSLGSFDAWPFLRAADAVASTPDRVEPI